MSCYVEGKTYIMYQTMVSLEGILSKQYFFRIDNSYLVNVSHIEKINEESLYRKQRTPHLRI